MTVTLTVVIGVLHSSISRLGYSPYKMVTAAGKISLPVFTGEGTTAAAKAKYQEWRKVLAGLIKTEGLKWEDILQEVGEPGTGGFIDEEKGKLVSIAGVA